MNQRLFGSGRMPESFTAFVPGTDIRQQSDGEQRSQREPNDAVLPPRQDNERGQQGSDGRARISAHLEERLRQSMLPAGGHPRNARRFRMKHGGAHADEPGGYENERIVGGHPDSRASPTSVNPIPNGSEYGLGFLSVYRPMSGCSMDAVNCVVKVISPIFAKSR